MCSTSIVRKEFFFSLCANKFGPFGTHTQVMILLFLHCRPVVSTLLDPRQLSLDPRLLWENPSSYFSLVWYFILFWGGAGGGLLVFLVQTPQQLKMFITFLYEMSGCIFCNMFAYLTVLTLHGIPWHPWKVAWQHGWEALLWTPKPACTVGGDFG